MSELAHVGVKGMKWGVRKDRETSSSRPSGLITSVKVRNLRINTERRNMIAARAAKSQVRVSEIKADLSKLPTKNLKWSQKEERKLLKEELSNTETRMKRDIREASKQPTDGMTKTQKRVLIGVGVAAAIGVTAYAIYNREEIGATTRTTINRLKGLDTFKKNEAFAKLKTHEDVFANVVKGANPNYATPGGMMNCRRVTFAYELRRRGYDVTATPSMVGRGQSETGLVNALIKGDKNLRATASMSSFAQSIKESPAASIRVGAVAKDKRTYSAITDSLNFKPFGNDRLRPEDARSYAEQIAKSLGSQPNGARGEIAFNMKAFIHSMQYEIFDGVPHIFDSQKAAHYPVTEQGMWSLMNKWGDAYGAAITRLDDVDLDMDFLAKWVTDR